MRRTLGKFRCDTMVPLEAVPRGLQEAVNPNAPAAGRRMAARALLPADPGDIVSMLSYLSRDPVEAIVKEAAKTLETLPPAILEPALGRPLHPSVLAFCAKFFLHGNARALETVILNAKTPDDAFAFVASNGKGRVLDIIAGNQVRILRHADIAEALYFNSETSMATANRAIETAIRGGIDISHIPGFDEITASILGRGEAAPQVEERRPAPESELPMPAEGAADFEADLLASLAEVAAETPAAAPSGGIDLPPEMMLLMLAEDDRDDEIEQIAEEERSSGALWTLVRKLDVAQKVRLAMVGNATARALLIHDPKKMVAMAVLKSPRLTDKEVSSFAKNKGTGDDVIRAIGDSREWTKAYSIRLALVMNPKTPPQKAATFMATLRERDIKALVKNHDVPGYLQRQAKAFLARKETKRK